MSVSIKEYVARAKELETAIYTQKKLMSKYEKHLLSKRPA